MKFSSKITFLALFFSFSSILAPQSAHADFTVAFLDVAKLLNDSTDSKSQRATLDTKAKATREKLEKRRSELKTLEKSIREKGLGESSPEVDQLRSQARAFEGLVHDAEDDIRKEYLKVNRSLSEKALKLVNDYAKKNGIDLVLDKGEQGRGPVLFGQSSLDITEKILEEMND